MRVDIDEAARLTGVTSIEIARLIQSRRLSYDKGPNGRKGVEVSALKGINGYMPPAPRPAPKRAAEPPVEDAQKTEVPLWYPDALEMREIVRMDDRGRAQRLAALTRLHPHLREHFRNNPLPPVFRRPEPPQPAPAPTVTEEPPAPPELPVEPPAPFLRPIEIDQKTDRPIRSLLAALMLAMVAFFAQPVLHQRTSLVIPYQPPAPRFHHMSHSVRRRRVVHRSSWHTPSPGRSPGYVYQAQ